MNENPRIIRTSGSDVSSVVMGFALGALIGAGIALLLAPGSGKETRQRLVDTGGRWRNAARSKFDQVRDTASGLKQDAKSALEAGREAFKQGQESREPRPAPRIDLNG
jgi:gas vesicle protein